MLPRGVSASTTANQNEALIDIRFDHEDAVPAEYIIALAER
jgi:hypothetical protein